ncbi:glycosyltransferase [Actinoalloteichus spitiensis]|uniref:glycosyltransferase n=1 Tax=Actinoalloteichus spitiensis TaxID=252394 RepID=UPI00035DCEFB|nr:glycosyltransferase [Actinoalloteichus spitiensis]
MRVLCTITGTPSHARALLPLARGLVAAGHELLVVAPPKPAAVFDGEPVRVEPVLSELADLVMRALAEGTSTVPADVDRHHQALWVMTGCGPHIVANHEAILPLARDFSPDLVLRDGTDFAGALVAEALGVPSVPAPSGTGQFLDPALVHAELNERRAELGLAPAADPLAMYPHGRLDCVPAELSFAREDAAPAFAYQQPATVTRAERLPDWVVELPADRPLVVASAGTMLPGFTPEPGQLPDSVTEHPFAVVPESFIAGLSELDCVGVVATGGIPVDPDLAGENVHVVDHIPQPSLLQCAQLFVTHGGYNSIRESMRAAVPMAVLPLFGDQEHNSDRLIELGLGVRVADPEGRYVAEACRTLLDDPGYGVRLRRAQRRMLALPPVESAVAHLEGLVR